ncbi:hypothetical protein K439DRAFT_946847 [Ramaria rubella]|nr:hypothetical protein K439DRAFT_946847 [Ramaria rubella]
MSLEVELPQISPSIFSLLPVELVRAIFEVSARDSSHAAAQLVRVSKMVHIWVLPILYETVVIRRREDFQLLESNLASPPPGVSLQHLIRNVCLSFPPIPAIEGRAITLFLQSCAQLQSMYLNDMDDILGTIHLPLHHKLLKHIHCGSAFWLIYDVLRFDNLTHLRVDRVYNNGSSRVFAPLIPPSKMLPHLTHFAIGTDSRNSMPEQRGTANFLQDVLARPGMRMLVVTAWYTWSRQIMNDAFASVNDRRLCILTVPNSPDHDSSMNGWQEGVRGRQSIWDKADAVIRQHRGPGIAIGRA